MPDPLFLPSLAALTGGSLLVARNYLQHRLVNTEDRYMALYGQEEWSASNMDLTIHAQPHADQALKKHFLQRLGAALRSPSSGTALLRERVNPHASTLAFIDDPSTDVDQLLQPRKGVYFELDTPGQIRVIWNHMQTDGVGMWSALRPLFDDNPPIVPFQDVPAPPPFLPELLALPRTARRLAWRSNLREAAHQTTELSRGFARWDTAPIRALKRQANAPFNLLTSAIAIHAVFSQHPSKPSLNVGLTAYFPFLQGRNRYSVFLCRVQRGDVVDIVQQLHRQVRSPMLNWGTSSTQAYALGRVPDRLFSRVVGYYRRQIDVLISSLPVGQHPVSLGGVPTLISCHPWELTLPYYFLLVGTRNDLNVSCTSRFAQTDGFLALDAHLPMMN